MAAVNYIKKGEGWLAAAPPLVENERLARLRKYQILDSLAEQSFDRITQLAATWFKLPFALVSLIDENRQWFKSCIGVDAKETDRDLAFCSHAIWQDEPLVIPDASLDKRFCGNPLVTGELHIRFYAGAPLIASDGLKMGTLCVIDNKPHEFTAEDGKVLSSLAALVIDEMELRLARLIAEEENAERSQYVSYISHEVRTPLTTIQSALSLAKGKKFDSESKGYLSAIGQATEILMETINDFLDVARMETLALQLEIIPFKPDDIINQVAELIRIRLKPGVNLEMKVSGENNVTLMGDPTRIRQIILNFVSNAAKFTESGTIRIILHLNSDIKGGMRLRVEVEDSGIGIPEEQLPELFKKFKQASISTARRYGGSGLGLHITKSLAELMGGSVGAKSVAGKGSTFWFEAPFQISEEKIEKENASSISAIAKCNILLVEDNRTNQALIKAMLQKAGHNVTSAYDGREALALTEEDKFDIILMDCQMPEMDGFAATIKIRARQNLVPIIALTANTSPEDKEKCLTAGMNDYLTKPVAIESIQQAIGKWVKG